MIPFRPFHIAVVLSFLLMNCGGASPLKGDGNASLTTVGGHPPGSGRMDGGPMGAKSDAEVLPAGKLRAISACLGSLKPGEAQGVPIPADGIVEFLFQGNFEPDLGTGDTPFEWKCWTGPFPTKGAPIRVVWSSGSWTEPKYRDILVGDLKDDTNLAVEVTGEDLRPKITDRLDFYFFLGEAYYVTQKDGSVQSYFYGPYLPQGTPHDSAPPPPSQEWKLISKDDLALFLAQKDLQGNPMVQPLGTVQFSLDLPSRF